MVRVLISTLLVLTLSVSVSAQRLCNSPYCRMCNALQAQAQVYQPVPIQPLAVVKPALSPTPMVAVKAMLEIAAPQKGEVLYDLGCGDGRFLVEAATRYEVECVGIERDPAQIVLAKRRLLAAPIAVSRRIRVFHGDVLNLDQIIVAHELRHPDIVVMYLEPEVTRVVVPRLRRARVVSFLHKLPKPYRIFTIDGKYRVYFRGVDYEM